MDYDLEGQVAIITGSARGIGFAISKELAGAGAQVVIADIRPEAAEQTAAELRGLGVKAVAEAVDVSSGSSVRAMVDRVIAKLGRIDILINNAGICPYTPFEEVTEEEWDRVLGINLKGIFLCSQAVLPAMKKRGKGKIVSIASMAGRTGGKASSVHYASSKAGVMGITRSMALHLGKYGVQVTAISPGVIQTEMTASWSEDMKSGFLKQCPAGRLGTVEDIAKVALFLCSGAADYLTGVVLDVTGGLVMS